MPYSITTRDGITIQNIPDNVPPDAPELRARVESLRAASTVPTSPGMEVVSGYGNRPDGTAKGEGWLGPIKTTDGRVMTELTIGVNIDGKETDIPTLVPTLTKDEIALLASGKPATDAIVQKAINHAVSRISKGLSPYAQQAPEPSLGQRLVGAGETALSLATAATGGTLGTIAGTAQGLSRSILSGKFGTQEAVREVERAAAEQAQRFTYQPRTAAGQEMTRAVGEVAQQVLPPVLPQIAAPGAIVSAARQQAPMVASTAGRVAAAAPQVARSAVEAPKQAVRAAGRAIGVLQPEQSALDSASATAAVLNRRGGVGAEAVSDDALRRARAEGLPIPMAGPAALTAGQASRNFSQLQFEKESAKLPIGAPLRERASNQTAVMIANFDALIDRMEPATVESRDIGRAVDRALVNRVEVKRREVRSAYDRARQSGEMQTPVAMDALAQRMGELNSLEGLVPTIGAVKREGVRLGALSVDENGQILPQSIPLERAETLRQFVNANTDWTDRREALVGRQINAAIDSATEGAGGNLYRDARKLRERFANEFENTGLTARLLSTKRGTNERQVAFEDVFDKVIISSPVDEIAKLRATLLRAGPEGRQAWTDMRAAGVRYIRDRATTGTTGQDEFGRPLLSPAALTKTVRSLDQEGKLDGIFGKKQAQTLRDLSDLSIDVYTAPPGSVNFSNTASALQLTLDGIATYGTIGIPAPAYTALKEASKYVKNRKTRARIDAALRGEVTATE